MARRPCDAIAVSVEDVRGLGFLRPDHFLDQLAVLLLPLGKHHLMADLQTVLLCVGRELGAAEQGGRVDLVERVRDLGLIDRAGLFDGMLQDQTAA